MDSPYTEGYMSLMPKLNKQSETRKQLLQCSRTSHHRPRIPSERKQALASAGEHRSPNRTTLMRPKSQPREREINRIEDKRRHARVPPPLAGRWHRGGTPVVPRAVPSVHPRVVKYKFCQPRLPKSIFTKHAKTDVRAAPTEKHPVRSHLTGNTQWVGGKQTTNRTSKANAQVLPRFAPPTPESHRPIRAGPL